MTETPRELWRRRVEATPDRPYLRDGERTWTFAEADVEARRIAHGLRELGVGVGSRVLVGMANRAETIFVHQALRELGAVLVPMLEGLTLGEVAFQVEHSEVETALLDATLAELVVPNRSRFPSLKHVVVGTETDAVAGADDVVRLPELDSGTAVEADPLTGYGELSPWAILYTSGSTGKPKGVVIPAGAFASAGKGYAEQYGITPADNYVLPLTLAHAVGALTAQAMTIHVGCRLTVLDRFSPSRWWDQVRAANGTFSIMFPAQLNLLLEVDDPDTVPGSHPFRLAITHVYDERFRDRFGVELVISWGMTETGATSVGTPAGYRGERGEGYVGTPMDGVEIAVMDPSLRRLGPYEGGEICLRHRHVMLEYLKEPELTANTVVEGWVRSGDLGYVDEEGGLYFRGRIKNMIKRAGENISAEEVEGALIEHPAVAETMVFGVPDRVRTEEVAAVVVCSGSGGVGPEELTEFAAERLARWKVPRYVELRDAPLPRLPNGKVDRVAVVSGLVVDECWDRERAR